MPEPPIDCCRNRSSAKLPVRCHLNHTVLCLIPLSAVNTTGRSRTVLNRIVLVAKGGTQCLKHSTKGSSTYEKHTWSHGTSTCNQLGYRDSNPEYRNQNPVPYRLAIAHHFQMTIIFIAKIAYKSK